MGWFVNLKEFTQVARSGRFEAAQRSKFVLCLCVKGRPVERSDMMNDMVSFGNSQVKSFTTSSSY